MPEDELLPLVLYQRYVICSLSKRSTIEVV